MSKYIVIKNCPSCTISPSCCTQYHLNNGHAKDCQDIDECLIKRVIDKCNYYQNKIGRTPQYRAGYVDATKDILDMFEIEEIKE